MNLGLPLACAGQSTGDRSFTFYEPGYCQATGRPIRDDPRPVKGPAHSIGRSKSPRYFSTVAFTSTVTVLSLNGSADFETSIGLPLSRTKFKIPR